MNNTEFKELLGREWSRSLADTHANIVDIRTAIGFLEVEEDLKFDLDEEAFSAECIVSELLGLGGEYLSKDQLSRVNSYREKMLRMMY